MKLIDHPNIVKLHEIYEDEKYLYFVMEHLKGGEVCWFWLNDIVCSSLNRS